MIGLQAQANLLFVETDPGFTFSGGPNYMKQMDRTNQRETVTTVTQAMDLVMSTYDEEDNILPNGWNDFRRDFMTDTGVASQGLLEVCPSRSRPAVAPAVAFAGTAFPLWSPSPPPRLLRQAI